MADHGPGSTPAYGASKLHIAILTARWNSPITSTLAKGARDALLRAGVPSENVIEQSVPGSYELPLAVQRVITAGNTGSSGGLVSAATDLLGASEASALGGGSVSEGESDDGKKKRISAPLDAVIAIGVLIKGSTMHFEYIADAVSHGLMRTQLDSGVPVIFGLLTCLDEEQAKMRAGMAAGKEGGTYAEKGHNHGEDWGNGAVEMAVKRKGWGEGNVLD